MAEGFELWHYLRNGWEFFPAVLLFASNDKRKAAGVMIVETRHYTHGELSDWTQ